MLLYRRKSIPYEKDDRLNISYAVGNLPAYFFDSIVYYPVTYSGLAFWPDRFFYGLPLRWRGNKNLVELAGV